MMIIMMMTLPLHLLTVEAFIGGTTTITTTTSGMRMRKNCFTQCSSCTGSSSSTSITLPSVAMASATSTYSETTKTTTTRSQTTSTTSSPSSTSRRDHVDGLQQLFTSTNTELHDVPLLQVEGNIPSYLVGGSLIRNGPAKFEYGPNEELNNYLDGAGMLHSITFEKENENEKNGGNDGDDNSIHVRYSNKFIQSEHYRSQQKQEEGGGGPKIRRIEFSSSPKKGNSNIFDRANAMWKFITNGIQNPNLNVLQYGDGKQRKSGTSSSSSSSSSIYVATGDCPSNGWIPFDLHTVESIKKHEGNGDVGDDHDHDHIMTFNDLLDASSRNEANRRLSYSIGACHGHTDPTTGDVYTMESEFLPFNTYTIYKTRAIVQDDEEEEVPQSSMEKQNKNPFLVPYQDYQSDSTRESLFSYRAFNEKKKVPMPPPSSSPRSKTSSSKPSTRLHREVLTTIPVSSGGGTRFMHSFIMSENYIVLVECPFCFNLWKAMKLAYDIVIDGQDNIPITNAFDWLPNLGTTFTILHKHNGDIVGRYHTKDSFLSMHQVNAFEEEAGDSDVKRLRIDMICHENKGTSSSQCPLNGLALDELRNPSSSTSEDNDGSSNSNEKARGISELRRYSIALDGGSKHRRGRHATSVSRTDLFPNVECEFPRINTRHAMGNPNYRYVYALGKPIGNAGFGELLKFDVSSKADTTSGCNGRRSLLRYPRPEDQDTKLLFSEPIFVPNGDADDSSENNNEAQEDDGVVLSVALDVNTKTSVLVGLDGKTFTEKFKIELPQHVPMTTHGEFIYK